MKRHDAVHIIDHADSLALDPRVVVKVANVVDAMTTVSPHLTAREIRLIEIASRVTIANEVQRKNRAIVVDPTVNGQ